MPQPVVLDGHPCHWVSQVHPSDETTAMSHDILRYEAGAAAQHEADPKP
ncbi:MAG: hypothetical protein H0V10_16405 [Geodermatophilaceae bacterium]|nr:hypothetical protein [Geodermatophilaceae bacterium]